MTESSVKSSSFVAYLVPEFRIEKLWCYLNMLPLSYLLHEETHGLYVDYREVLDQMWPMRKTEDIS
jgi:hypothetical protein